MKKIFLTIAISIIVLACGGGGGAAAGSSSSLAPSGTGYNVPDNFQPADTE
jgi:hypothetical protein